MIWQQLNPLCEIFLCMFKMKKCVTKKKTQNVLTFAYLSTSLRPKDVAYCAESIYLHPLMVCLFLALSRSPIISSSSLPWFLGSYWIGQLFLDCILGHFCAHMFVHIIILFHKRAFPHNSTTKHGGLSSESRPWLISYVCDKPCGSFHFNVTYMWCLS